MDALVLQGLEFCVNLIVNEKGQPSVDSTDKFLTLYAEIYDLESKEFEEVEISTILKPLAVFISQRKIALKIASKVQKKNPQISIEIDSDNGIKTVHNDP